MKSTVHFESFEFDFGKVKPTDKVEFKFDYLGDPDDIEYISASCGCTVSYYNPEEKAVKGVLDIAIARGKYEPGENVLTKNVFVYMADGRSHYVGNARKEIMDNQLKTHYVLTLKGIVVQE
jgi:hypothetical protein